MCLPEEEGEDEVNQGAILKAYSALRIFFGEKYCMSQLERTEKGRYYEAKSMSNSQSLSSRPSSTDRSSIKNR